jgi:hypothetical protein
LPELANAGVAHRTQPGGKRIWELDTRAFLDARTYVDTVSAQRDINLSRLKQFVEQEERSEAITDTL